MKQIFGCLLVGVFLTGCLDEEDNPFSALTADRDDLIGTWMVDVDDLKKLEDFEGFEDINALDGTVESFETTFKDDGTVVDSIGIAGEIVELSGEWSLKGNTLTRIQNGKSLEFIIVITGSTLTMTDTANVLIHYTRKS